MTKNLYPALICLLLALSAILSYFDLKRDALINQPTTITKGSPQ